MYGDVPPVAVKVMVPLFPPKQLTLVFVVDALSADTGCVIVPDDVVVHPLLSVIVTVYVPAPNPFLFWLVTPPPQLKV